jgi:integrase
MPIEDAPNAKNRDRKRVTYYDREGKLCVLVRRNRRLAEIEIAANAGAKSAADRLELSTAVVVDWWFRDQERRLVKPETLKQQRRQIERFLVKEHGGRTFSTLAVEDITKIHDDMLPGYVDTTIYGVAQLIAQLFREGVRQGFISWNPAAVALSGLDGPERLEQRPFHPDEDELGRIRKAAYPLALAAVDCMAEAGATPSEICRIRRGDCDYRGRTLLLRGSPTSYDPDGIKLARTVPMSDRLAGSLVRLAATRLPRLLLFGVEDGSQRAIGDLRRHVEAAQIRADVVRPAGDPNGRTGRDKARKGPEEGHGSLPFAKYEAVAFRHVAAVRWSANTGIKGLSELLGISATNAELVYGYIYDNKYMLKWVLENPPGL